MARSGTTTQHAPDGPLHGLDDTVRKELVRRLREIEVDYRAAAQKMGQLYMYADLHAGAGFTRRLDPPMRDAADSERAVAALIDELQMTTKRQAPGKKQA